MSALVWLVLPALLGLGWLGLRWLRRELTPAPLAHPPASTAQLPVEWVSIPTQNGKRLAAQWWHAGASEGERGVAVLLHGWGGNGSQLLAAAQVLRRHGWSVLLPDARGHGRSDADSYSALPRFAEDLDASVDWVRRRQSSSGQTVPLVLLGHSVGAAAALLCASRRSDIAAVVSVSAFAHPEQVMRRWLAQYHIPFWPLGWLVNRYVERVIGYRFDAIAPVTCIARIQVPVLLVHGQQDDVVPLACAARLQGAAPHARLLVVAGRHDSFEDEPDLHQRVTRWLDEVCVKHGWATSARPTMPVHHASEIRAPGL